jgi:hypothetical protein
MQKLQLWTKSYFLLKKKGGVSGANTSVGLVERYLLYISPMQCGKRPLTNLPSGNFGWRVTQL